MQATLGAWAERILAQPFEEAYVYLKHEALGPMYAAHLEAVTSGKTPPELPPPEAEVAEPEPKKKTRKAKAKKKE